MSTLFNSINFAKLAEMRPDALRNLVTTVENLKTPAAQQHETAHADARVAAESFSMPSSVTFDKATRTLLTKEGAKLNFAKMTIETSDGQEVELPKHLATFASNVLQASGGRIDWPGLQTLGERIQKTANGIPMKNPTGNAR